MILSLEQIKKFIEKPLASDLLSEAAASQTKHKLHVTGEGFNVQKINGLESPLNYDIKKEVARPVTTRIYKSVKNQFSKVFRAKGFFRNYEFADRNKELRDDFKSYLEDIGGGLSIKELMNIVWFKAMFEEFNGVFIVELPSVQEEQYAEPKVKFKDLDHIHDILIVGQKVEYIIFKWTVNENGKNVEHYRVIDDAFDYHFIKVNADIKLATNDGEEDVIPNVWGYVPCIQPSVLTKTVENDILKKSFVEETMSNADYYLSISNGHAVSVKLHQNPIFYSYPVTCPTCNGSEYIYKDEEQVECTGCKGSGQVPFFRKDPSEGILLPEPEADQDYKGAEAPCGYVAPDLETLKEQRSEMEKEEELIEKGVFGVAVSLAREGGAETATGREIDQQPMFDTLTSFSQNGEFVEAFLTDAIGIARYNDSNDTGKRYEGSTILWGKQFFIRSSDVIEKEYKTAKEAGAPDYFLNGLLEELNHTKYDNNPTALQRSKILNDLEPFQTYTLKELVDVAISTQEDLIIKQYFNDFVERFERENMNVVDFMHNATYQVKIDAINAEFEKYAIEKKVPEAVESVEVDAGLVSDLKKNIIAGIETVESARNMLREKGYKEETITKLIN